LPAFELESGAGGFGFVVAGLMDGGVSAREPVVRGDAADDGVEARLVRVFDNFAGDACGITAT
jgi:hypothetical protein